MNVQGRHFVLVADGRLGASDKITGLGEGVGEWWSFTSENLQKHFCFRMARNNCDLQSMTVKPPNPYLPSPLGPGSVIISKRVDDGAWHELQWRRQYRRIGLVVDQTAAGQADLPSGNTVLDVHDGVLVAMGGAPNATHAPNGSSTLLYFDWLDMATMTSQVSVTCANWPPAH